MLGPYVPRPGGSQPLDQAIRRAMDHFNAVAGRFAFVLTVGGGPEEIRLSVERVGSGRGSSYRVPGLDFFFLWNGFFRLRGWKRTKLCPHCLEWFIDFTQNHRSVFCSPGCKDHFWNRERRQKASHRRTAKAVVKPGRSKSA